MPKFRKKPVEIEALQWVGNAGEMFEFLKEGGRGFKLDAENKTVVINTLEGDMTANLNDWIICGVHGEHYPCKPDIFEATYEAV